MLKSLIVLLRGINVGGKHVLPMKTLVSILSELGCHDVTTYIQSGNVVLRAPPAIQRILPVQIRKAVERQQGFAPHVFVIDVKSFNRVLSNNPFPEAECEPQTLHVGFLAARPPTPDIEALERLRSPAERFKLFRGHWYLHAPDGLGRSKLAASAEKLIGVPMTLRNWRTLQRLRNHPKPKKGQA